MISTGLFQFRLLALLALCAPIWMSAPGKAAPAASVDPSGFSFTSIETADLARAEAFYVGAVGFKQVIRLTPPDSPVVKIGYNFSGNPNSTEPLLILIHYVAPKPDQNHSSGAKIGFRVPDAKAAMERIRAAGFPVIKEAEESKDVPMIKGVARDPDGVIVEIVQYKSNGN